MKITNKLEMVQPKAGDAELNNPDIEGEDGGRVKIHAQSVGNAPKLAKAVFATQGSN